MSISVDDIIVSLKNFNEEELLKINKIVCMTIRSKRSERNTIAKSKLNLGDSVFFEGRIRDRRGKLIRGRTKTVTGSIIKIKRKYVHVKDPTGSIWNVPISQISPAE